MDIRRYQREWWTRTASAARRKKKRAYWHRTREARLAQRAEYRKKNREALRIKEKNRRIAAALAEQKQQTGLFLDRDPLLDALNRQAHQR